jgi:hypothetical protein
LPMPADQRCSLTVMPTGIRFPTGAPMALKMCRPYCGGLCARKISAAHGMPSFSSA